MQKHGGHRDLCILEGEAQSTSCLRSRTAEQATELNSFKQSKR